MALFSWAGRPVGARCLCCCTRAFSASRTRIYRCARNSKLANDLAQEQGGANQGSSNLRKFGKLITLNRFSMHSLQPLFATHILRYSVILTLCLFATVSNAQQSHTNVEQNKAIARRYFEEMVNKQNLDILDELVSKDRVSHGLLDGKEGARGIEPLRKFLVYLFKAFPDIHYTIGDIIAEDDKVVARVIFSGTHKDEFFGYPASNTRIDYLSEIFFMRIENGKIAEAWTQLDLYNLFKSLRGEK